MWYLCRRVKCPDIGDFSLDPKNGAFDGKVQPDRLVLYDRRGSLNHSVEVEEADVSNEAVERSVPEMQRGLHLN